MNYNLCYVYSILIRQISENIILKLMEIASLTQRLQKLINEEVHLHNRKHVHAAEIRQIILKIAEDMLTGYDSQRESVSRLLSVYEENTYHILGLLIPMFLGGLEELKKLQIEPLDLSFWDAPFDIDEVSKDFLSFYEGNLTRGKAIRLSEDVALSIDVATAGRFLRLIHKLITPVTIKQRLNADDASSIIMQLWIGRNIARAINRKEIFYFLTSIFLDSLHFNQNYQFARDVAEECLICFYKDEMPGFGYYFSFKVFASTASSVTALHYAIIANIALLKQNDITDYLLKNYYWEAIKFFRNLLLIPFAVSLFENRPRNVSYTSYESNKFFHAYYSTLFYTKDKKMPSEVLDYIDKNKEVIIATGEHEVLPWLAMLFNIKKNYTPAEYDEPHLNQFVELFRRVVSDENYNRFYKSLFGSLEDLSAELKECLLNLTFTRNPSDFVTDNKLALQVSHRNILESFKIENVEGYLLSMILQSDFSIVFKDKDTKLLLPIHESYASKDFEKEYYTPEYLKLFISRQRQMAILWLGTDNHVILPLYCANENYVFLKEKERSLHDAIVFARDIIKVLPLATRTKEKSSYEKVYEDYKLEEDNLKKELDFISMLFEPEGTLLLIKDIVLSSFPHNLITTPKDFISNLVPVANIMSLEWFLENQVDTPFKNPRKAIWIPVESGDMSIMMMYSKMNDDIRRLGVTEYKKIIPESSLDADINILVAHGSEGISTFPALYLSNSVDTLSIRNFDYIVGEGKILILFVCHSGSEKSDLYRNQTLTVVKQFLQNGYKAVIAPFWALHIDIPPIWLPEFLNSLASGDDVGAAFFAANRKVAETFNTPNAYACLHLYGNPFVKFG